VFERDCESRGEDTILLGRRRGPALLFVPGFQPFIPPGWFTGPDLRGSPESSPPSARNKRSYDDTPRQSPDLPERDLLESRLVRDPPLPSTRKGRVGSPIHRSLSRSGSSGAELKSLELEAESQWIVATRLLCHVRYPVPYLSRLQRILIA
jgi:hypothetical protein